MTQKADASPTLCGFQHGKSNQIHTNPLKPPVAKEPGSITPAQARIPYASCVKSAI